MNDLDLLAYLLAEEAVRRKKLEIENAQLKKRLLDMQALENQDGETQKG